MHTHRIDIFHITYSDTVSCTVPHYFIFNFFPACDAAFHQNLSHTAETKAVGKNIYQFIQIMGNTTAASAQCISRTKHHRISDPVGKFNTFFHGFHYLRRCARLADLLHGVFKFLTVFRFLYGLRRCSDQFYIMRLQEAGLVQLHGKIQCCLAAQCGKHTVRFLNLYQLFQNFNGQRFYIYFISDIFIRHNGGRIRVHKNNFNPFFFQGTACLCSGIVKLCSLSDNDRTGTNDQYFFYIRILRHSFFLPSYL